MCGGRQYKSECRTQLCPSFAATTTAEGVDRLKDLLLGIYSEQLYSRPKPPNRSQKSFDSILHTSFKACSSRLQELHTVPSVWAFASKCLREREWKEKFQAAGAEICSSNCIDQDLQLAFVNAMEEPPDFEKSLDFSLETFSVHLRSDVDCIDLDPATGSVPQSDRVEPNSFQVSLRSAEKVIDLD